MKDIMKKIGKIKLNVFQVILIVAVIEIAISLEIWYLI